MQLVPQYSRIDLVVIQYRFMVECKCLPLLDILYVCTRHLAANHLARTFAIGNNTSKGVDSCVAVSELCF
jgi:hypothetical protein